MSRSWSGPLVTGLIVVGIAAILVFNLQPSSKALKSPPVPVTVGESKPTVDQGTPSRPGTKEYPIGDLVEKNHIRIVAVWLSAVQMEGMATGAPGASDLIHLEADIKATEDNPNGFAKDEFIPYLKVAYSLVPAQGGPAIEKGELVPMIAWDGLHYGANIVMPKSGEYRLLYDIEPPSAGGLGRHSDPATGVAPWWKPFQAAFSWTVDPNPSTVAESR